MKNRNRLEVLGFEVEAQAGSLRRVHSAMESLLACKALISDPMARISC